MKTKQFVEIFFLSHENFEYLEMISKSIKKDQNENSAPMIQGMSSSVVVTDFSGYHVSRPASPVASGR